MSFLDHRKVVLIDGDCSMCNGFARLLLRNHDSIFVGSLGSDYGKNLIRLIDSESTGHGETIIYVHGSSYYLKSSAILRIGQGMRFPLNLISRVLLLVPRKIRDFLYDFVAKRRRKIFLGSCSLDQSTHEHYRRIV